MNKNEKNPLDNNADIDIIKDPKDTSEHIEVDLEELENEDIQHVNNPIVGLKPIEKEFLGSVKEVRQENNKYIFSDGAA